MEAQSYPMLERKVKNPVKKDTFEKRLENIHNSWERLIKSEEIEWRIVKIGYGHIRRPFVKN